MNANFWKVPPKSKWNISSCLFLHFFSVNTFSRHSPTLSRLSLQMHSDIVIKKKSGLNINWKLADRGFIFKCRSADDINQECACSRNIKIRYHSAIFAESVSKCTNMKCCTMFRECDGSTGGLELQSMRRCNIETLKLPRTSKLCDRFSFSFGPHVHHPGNQYRKIGVSVNASLSYLLRDQLW